MVYTFICMDILSALFLGIVEGLTEFLPISSTGHLLVTEKLIDFKDETALFTVVIQLGAILSAGWYFRKDLVYIISSLARGDKVMRRFVWSVFIGVLPAGIVGLIVEKTIGLPDALPLIALTMIVGGIAFLFIENRVTKKPLQSGEVAYDDITPRRALYVGLGQCLAIIPGVSRSGATIMSGLLAGLDRKTATIFSFYLSIPIMVSASALKLLDGRSTLSSITGGTPALVVGVISAFITALLVINWLLKYVTTNSFKPFAYYRIAVGFILAVALILN